MNVVGISGSPRTGGNTQCLVEECLREFSSHGWTVSFFNLSEKTVKPCGAIAVGRGEGCGQSNTLMIIYNYVLSSGGLPVPGELNGLSARADKPGDIMRQERRLAQARVLARNIMKYAEKLR